jgi:purine catabolism regulator
VINNIIDILRSERTIKEQDSYLTVEEALNLTMLSGYEILGGKSGLKNKCKHMTILETPEGIGWLEGEEFLITAGYAFYGRDDLKQSMIKDANDRGVSAIGIKDMRYFGDISENLISDSNEYGIPLIKIPYEVRYTEMISDFYNLLFYRKNEYILNLNNIYESLLKLSFEDKEIEEIIYTLSNISSSNVFLFDNKHNLISQNIFDVDCYNKIAALSPFNKSGDNFSSDIEKFYINQKINDTYISTYPIIKKNIKTAFVYVVNTVKIDVLNQSAIDYGVSIISSKIEKNKLVKFNQPKYKKTLVEVMLNNKDLPYEFYINFERDIGWDKEGDIIGLCIKSDVMDEKNAESSKLIIQDVLGGEKSHENILAIDKGNDIFAFVKLESGDFLQEVITNIHNKLKAYKNMFLVSIGVSNSYTGLQDIEKLYNESYLAVLFSSFDIVYFKSLDTIKLLYPLKNDEEVGKYFNKTIKKLQIYDIKHDTNLVDTLEAYFGYNLNNKLTSSKLFIHIETLRYRLNRIEEITGFSPNETEGIFALQMGLKLMKLIGLK